MGEYYCTWNYAEIQIFVILILADDVEGAGRGGVVATPQKKSNYAQSA